MTERDVRVAMLPKWKAVQEAFIRDTGGDCNASPERYPEAFRRRELAEDALREEYRARAARVLHSNR